MHEYMHTYIYMYKHTYIYICVSCHKDPDLSTCKGLDFGTFFGQPGWGSNSEALVLRGLGELLQRDASEPSA